MVPHVVSPSDIPTAAALDNGYGQWDFPQEAGGTVNLNIGNVAESVHFLSSRLWMPVPYVHEHENQN